MSAPRRTRRPSAATSPPRPRVLRHASHTRARVASFALSPNDATDVGDAHDDEQEEKEHEADRMDSGLDLRREAPAEDPADEDEEEASAVEARERHDVEHREVHREHADELQERRDPVLRDLPRDAKDLDRP